MGPRATFLGIETGGTKVQVVAGDATGQILDRRRFEVDQTQGGAGICAQIESALPELLARWKPQAIGVGFGGPVDWRTGRICCSHQIEGWAEFELGDWLRKLSGLPVCVDNDANIAALGEAWVGAGRGKNPLFYVTLGSGVGGGCVVDGKVFHGARPGESELGHVRLDRQGTIVESRCSGWAVDRKIRSAIASSEQTILRELVGSSTGNEAKHLSAALATGDRVARVILQSTAEDLAFGLSHVMHLFHPEVVVLGGGLALVGEPLRDAVAQALPGLVMGAFGGGPEIKLAELGEDVVPVGCLLAARQFQAGNRISE